MVDPSLAERVFVVIPFARFIGVMLEWAMSCP
jgi:hypothetical protein